MSCQTYLFQIESFLSQFFSLVKKIGKYVAIIFNSTKYTGQWVKLLSDIKLFALLIKGVKE